MHEQGLAARYARALFGAAVARGSEARVGEDLAAIQTFEEKGVSLRIFLEAPNIRDDVKSRAIDESLGKSADEMTVRFFHLLLAKRRTGLVREATAVYLDLLREKQGKVRARVTTATALADDLLQSLRAAMERHTGQQVELQTHVDPAVLGGISVQWGDQILDDTVRTRLATIREQLLGVEI